MNRLAFLGACIVLAGVLPSYSQTEPGNWELSVAGNIGSVSTSYEYKSGSYVSSGSSDGITYMGLDVRAGAYIANGLALEPEIYALFIEDQSPAFNFGANISYTFTLPESPVSPFLIAGYGIGNASPIMQRLVNRGSDEFDIPVLRVGGGLKVFLGKQVALKVEYRYERYSQERTETYYGHSSTSKTVVNYHNVMIGFSVFIPGGE